MTLHWSLTKVLILMVMFASTLGDGPPLKISSLTQDAGGHSTAPPPPSSGPGRGVSGQNVLHQVVGKVFPAYLWTTLTEWPPAPHDPPCSDQENKTHLQDSMDHQVDVFSFYLPDTTNASQTCRTHVQAFFLGLSEGEVWALKMVDSWGKFPDGLLGGNTWVTGMLDECVQVRADIKVPPIHFTGQYCAITYTHKEADARVAAVAGSMGLVLPYSLYGTCIPSTCTREEYANGLQAHLEHQGLELSSIACQTKDLATMQYTTADVVMIIVLCLLAVLVLLGTGVDLWLIRTDRKHEEAGSLRYILVFSFHTNLQKIFHINVNQSDEVISCLHGIRVLSLTWIVLGHTYLLSPYYSVNKEQMLNMVKEHPYFYQLILNAYPSVDTFFFMSGLLVAYNLTKEFHKNRKFNLPLFYIHRVLRLTPAILLLCGVLAVFPPLVVRGALSPLLTEPGYMVDLCQRYWWRDALFLTNWFFITEGPQLTSTESCLPVCWFTAIDFQLYIVTPLMFLPVLYYRRPGAVWLALLLVASIAIPAIIIGVNELPPTLVLDVTPQASKKTDNSVYMMPWCRATPYLVGLILGYLLRVVDRNKVQLRWWQAVLGWIVAVATMSAVVFGLHEYNTLSQKPHEYDPAVSILYGGFHRLAWGAAVAWMVFACHMGYGGPVQSVLAHPFWQPFSRLTYTTFLIAFNTQFLILLYMVRVPSYFNDINKVLEATGVLLLTGCGGVLLSLLAESPVLGLEKILLRREKLH